MNYSNDIQKCIWYIECNIKEALTVERISNYMGYSVYHFCRIFQICNGITLMDYVRKRKLSLAATDLRKGMKIIDVALEYGFETPSGFTKAFRKEYKLSPSRYLARMAGYLETNSNYNIGGYIMDPTFVKKPAFQVAGYGIETNIAGCNYTRDIASFWVNYEGENLECKMYEFLNPPKHGEVGLCVPSSDNGNVTYLLGVIVDDFDKVQEDMITVTVPEAEYAVFTTPPVDTSNDPEQKEFAQIIKETWKYIFDEWFKNSEYEYDDSKLDFEYYDERCHGRIDTVMEIYVPIKKIN